MVAMKDQTQARMGSLLAMGGRERLVPPSESKIESSHFMSPMEDSMWLNHPIGDGSATPAYFPLLFFFGFWNFFFLVMGAFWE
jgi:hypothetical protein